MNGWLSESFNLNRGIGRGYPLSALLFIIAVEMLYASIKQNQEIKGVQLADDTTFDKKFRDVLW